MNKSIYGLKQTAKAWYEELANFPVKPNFVRSKYDYCFFSKNEKGKKIFVLSWVDDLVIAGSSLEIVEELKKMLQRKFKMDNQEKRMVPRHANK